MKARRSNIVGFLAFALAIFMAWPLSASGSDVGDLLRRVAVSPPARVAFCEERHNPMLQEPLVLTGHLEYLAPGQLKKVIETPFREVFTVSDKSVEIERDGEVQKLSLGRSRSLQTMLGGIEAIIAGDESRLADAFELDLQESPEGWSIRFTPRSRRIARNLQRILVNGHVDEISHIRIDLGDGEWHGMDLLKESDEP